VLPIASRIVPPPRGSKPVAGSRAVPAAEHAAGTFAPSAAERATLMESSRTQPWEPLGDVDELNVNAVPRRRRIALLAACAQEIHPRPTRPRQATRCPGREFPDAARPICSARRALEHMLLITHDIARSETLCQDLSWGCTPACHLVSASGRGANDWNDPKRHLAGGRKA
jgi:hypothetical protein